ncbi:MAG: IscS subfamily cysteine desulfurase [Planctomycetota bacterium]
MNSQAQPIYLDNAATTRVAPEAVEAMRPFFDLSYGNAATLYTLGTEASVAVEEAREQVASLIHAADPEEIVFTSGGTESDNWVLASSVLGTKKKHLVTSAIEHHAILEPCARLQKLGLGVEVTVLPVDGLGRVDPGALRSALRADTALVSIMHANNEIGTIEPIRALAAVARERGVLFHADAVQTVGKIPVDVQDLGVDFLSLSGHKFHGPKGVGALYLRRGARLKPFQHGGAQERNRRGGTTNVPGVVGMGEAARLAKEALVGEGPRLRGLVERLWKAIEERIPQVVRNGDPEAALPGLLSICVAGAEGEAMIMYLSLEHGICVSSGSACSTGSLDPSHVLLAIGRPAEVAHGSLRLSLSRYTTAEEIETVIRALPREVERVRAMSPTWKG